MYKKLHEFCSLPAWRFTSLCNLFITLKLVVYLWHWSFAIDNGFCPYVGWDRNGRGRTRRRRCKSCTKMKLRELLVTFQNSSLAPFMQKFRRRRCSYFMYQDGDGWYRPISLRRWRLLSLASANAKVPPPRSRKNGIKGCKSQIVMQKKAD